jgi:hypothetical protein
MNYLDDNIFVIDNFLSKDEFVLAQNGTNVDLIKLKISQIFNGKYFVNGSGQVRTILTGESTEPHSDQHAVGCGCGYCILNNATVKLYGTVLYLNDNYTGGEINYTKRGITHRPKENSLICHPASEDYEHQVLKVTSGERKFISFFLSQNNDVI